MVMPRKRKDSKLNTPRKGVRKRSPEALRIEADYKRKKRSIDSQVSSVSQGSTKPKKNSPAKKKSVMDKVKTRLSDVEDRLMGRNHPNPNLGFPSPGSAAQKNRSKGKVAKERSAPKYRG